ncbi:MAG: 3'-5' exonuclease [Xenococcaceae cyanobacterium]
MSIPPIRLAITADFFYAFSKLPKQIQSKTNKLIDDFKKNPTKTGLNYETIQNARDPNLKSLRVDQTYRAIIRKPDQGNTYLLLWVDKHDEAYQWGQHRLCKINPESGALQIIDVEQAKNLETEISQRKTPQIPGRFNDISNCHLLRLGVPEELLGAVRSVVTDQDIDLLLPQLPEEAADAILMLGAGYSLDAVFEQQQKPDAQVIDTSNIDAALDRDDSKQRFYVVEDDGALSEMLAAPLEKWRVFLHPSQRRLVERDWNGPVRVLGGAGTGKTVVAMHRAKWLAQYRFTQESDRIFFTTFTRNLAVDIEMNLRKICSSETMKRIHVENIDAWVVNFLKNEGIATKIVYDGQVKPLWEQAYTIAPSSPSLPLSFYKDEWREVIQANGIWTLKDYLKISRLGRGTSLKRSERAAIWPVFEEYRFLLQHKGWKEIEDALRDACSLLKSKPGITLPFQSIIVDEGQDMSEGVFHLLRTMVPSREEGNDLFIVGDPHQRIYGRKVILGHCGIEIRGRSCKLRINYRTTEQIRQWATAILEGIDFDDLNGESDDLKDYRSLLRGEVPLVQGFNSFEKEVEFLVKELQKISSENQPLASCCLILRTNQLVERYRHALQQHKIPTHKIRRSEPDNQAISGVRVATMHRVKGLQFDYIFLPSINQGLVPLEATLQTISDETARQNILNLERSLIHVAATRAKQEVTVTYYGEASLFLTQLNTRP